MLCWTRRISGSAFRVSRSTLGKSNIINRLLDGFEGKLTTSKWAALAKSSTDSALRDINELVELGVLERSGAGGCSISYNLVRKPAGPQP
jgi:Fic family protein